MMFSLCLMCDLKYLLSCIAKQARLLVARRNDADVETLSRQVTANLKMGVEHCGWKFGGK